MAQDVLAVPTHSGRGGEEAMTNVPRSDLTMGGRLGYQVTMTKAGWGVDLRCPDGHIGSLGSHSIANDGVVTPSVICPHEGCTWHATIKLNNWTPEVG